MLESVRTACGRLSSVDLGFAALRAVVAGGALCWLVVAPVSADLGRFFSLLFVGFCAYSAVLYATLLRWPREARRIYLAALVLDALFLFWVVRHTGGVQSDFVLGFYLMVALHSFYYGWKLGLVVAGGSAALCVLSDPGALRALHWTSLAVRLMFLPVAAVWLGALSEWQRRQRRRALELGDRIRRASEQAQRMQEKLRHADRLAAFGKVAAQLAHQIKNPLGSIALNVEMLQGELAALEGVDTAEAEELLRSVSAEIDLLAELTENHLRYARLPTVEPTPTGVNEVLEELIDFLNAEMSRGSVTITADLPADLPSVPLDRKQMKLAIANLMSNSLEAMAGGGRLRVATSAQNGSVRIELSDTGGGVPRGAEERIFEMFFSTKAQGSGLGLTMTKKIVEDHGGTISCRSVPGAGATFTIDVPLNGHTAGNRHGHPPAVDGPDRR